MYICLTFKEIEENKLQEDVMVIYSTVSKLPEWDPESETDFVCCQVAESYKLKPLALKKEVFITYIWMTYDSILQTNEIRISFSNRRGFGFDIKKVDEFPETPFNSMEFNNNKVVYSKNIPLHVNYLYYAARMLGRFEIIDVRNINQLFIHFREFVPYVKPLLPPR